MTIVQNKNIPYYLAAILIFILLNWGFTFTNNNQLIFLLHPTNQVVERLTHSKSSFFVDMGFYHAQFHIFIDKSCSGFKFGAISFLVLTYLVLPYIKRPVYKVLTIPIVLLSVYPLTILVNTSRILASIIVQKQADKILPPRPHLILHDIVGTITHLSFLIIFYYLIEKLLK